MRSHLFNFLLQFIVAWVNIIWLKVTRVKVACAKVTWFSVIVMALVATGAQAAQTIVVFGDSLSAAYGIQPNTGWVVLLDNKLQQQNSDVKVINASISGETTSGGLSRFNQMLITHKPDIIVLELGANDGLRGLSLSEMQSNLNSMISKAKAANATVMLLGMKIPPNYGIQYTQKFSAVYSSLAAKYQLNLVPFFLDGVAGNPSLILDDGLHPTAAAQPQLLENIWPTLKTLLKK